MTQTRQERTDATPDPAGEVLGQLMTTSRPPPGWC